MGKQLIRDYVFTPGGAGAGTIEIPVDLYFGPIPNHY